MGAVETILAVVAVLREYGVQVTFEPGWETRGNGTSAAYEGGVIHHTAIPATYANPSPGTRVLRDGRPDLDGPLCNLQGCYDGSVRVIAAQPANHAGASGGRSMGPLPTTRLFNARVLGLEIDYAGDSPMSPQQYRTAQVFAVAIKRVFGRPSLEWTRGHAETSIEGKWDPGYAPGRTIDLAAFRRDAAATLTQEEDMANVSQEQLNTLLAGANSVLGGVLKVRNAGELFGLVYNVSLEQAAQRALLAQALNDPDVTPDHLEQVVRDAVKEAQASLVASVQSAVNSATAAVREIVGARDEDLAQEVVDEIGRRTAPPSSAPHDPSKGGI